MKRSAILLCLPALLFADSKKLSESERIEFIRGLTAETGSVRVLLPRSRKPLPLDSSGEYDKKYWEQLGKESGPAARVGDQVQITKVQIEGEHLVLEINGGFRGGRKWYDSVQVGSSTSGGMTPIGNADSNAPGGTSISINFGEPVPALQAVEVKKILKSVIDFDLHSSTQITLDSLPPEIRTAVLAKRVIEGMDRDQVIMSVGKPRTKTRETNNDGIEAEDWIYGVPPGRILFVTFNGNKVIKVKEAYAGLGGQTAAPLPVQ